MANRALLHRNQLAAFMEFLEKEGIEFRDGRGDWQVLQVKNRRHGGWDSIFDSLRKEHYVVPRPLIGLVKKFIKTKRKEI